MTDLDKLLLAACIVLLLDIVLLHARVRRRDDDLKKAQNEASEDRRRRKQMEARCEFLWLESRGKTLPPSVEAMIRGLCDYTGLHITEKERSVSKAIAPQDSVVARKDEDL